MANDCSCYFKIKSNDKELLDAIAASKTDGDFFSVFYLRFNGVQMKDTPAAKFKNKLKNPKHYKPELEDVGQYFQLAKIERYGVDVLGRTKTTITVGTSTAWRQPTYFCEMLDAEGIKAECYYYEPGMHYYGNIINGIETSGDMQSQEEALELYPKAVYNYFGLQQAFERDVYWSAELRDTLKLYRAQKISQKEFSKRALFAWEEFTLEMNADYAGKTITPAVVKEMLRRIKDDDIEWD